MNTRTNPQRRLQRMSARHVRAAERAYRQLCEGKPVVLRAAVNDALTCLLAIELKNVDNA